MGITPMFVDIGLQPDSGTKMLQQGWAPHIVFNLWALHKETGQIILKFDT